MAPVRGVMQKRVLALVTVTIGVLAMTACVPQQLVPPAPSVWSPAPTPVPSAVPVPLTCDDVASDGDVAAALAGSATEAPTVVAAIQPSTALRDLAVTAAGGLSCSWRAGAPQDDPLAYVDGADWAYLAVRIMPNAGGPVTQPQGEGAWNEIREIAGVEAGMRCGDPGCVISASVGATWVQVTMRSAGFGTTGLRYASMPTGEILDQLRPVAAAAIAAVAKAQPEQLVWPRIERHPNAPACDGALKSQGVAYALDMSDLTYRLVDSHPGLFEAHAPSAVGIFRCEVSEVSGGGTSITVGRSLAATFDTVASQPDMSTGFRSVALEGAADGEHAILACSDISGFCSILFTLGDSAYQVDSGVNAVAVAEAIIAQAR